MSVRATLLGITMLALGIAALGLLIAILAHVAILTGPSGPSGQSAINQWIFLVSAAVVVALLGVLIIIGVDDATRGVPFSPLYWPFLWTKACLAALMGMIAVSAADYILHGPRLEWTFMFDPEVRVLASLLYFGLVVSLGWQMVVILLGRVRAER